MILDLGVLDALDITSIERGYKEILNQTKHAFPEVMNRINQEGRIGEKDMERLKDFITKVRI